jgi:asparaginyl-tRNA synthetase
MTEPAPERLAAGARDARVAELPGLAGEAVRLRGWLYHMRSSRQLHFLELRDGSGIVQCVVSKADVGEPLFELAGSLTQESSIVLAGQVRAEPRAKGGVELQVRELELVQRAHDYPITPKEHGVSFLLDHRHLWLRSRRPHAILRIRDEVERAIGDFFHARGYLRLDAPILTPAACEGSTTLFETRYFDETAYLTQSGQLYAEAGAMAFGRVYTFGPTFRAEKSKTRRHLMEFWMIEPETAFLDHEGNVELAEALVCALVERVLERCAPELEVLERPRAPLEAVQRPFPRLRYRQAVEQLRALGHPVEVGHDFGGDEETALAAAHDRPLVVDRYPWALKPFYMRRDPGDPSVVLNLDVLAPEGYGEIVGGSVREERLDVLDAQMAEKGIDPAPLEWYRDLRRYGTVPHAGFGLGLERTLAWLCGVPHLRETIPFPRLMARLHP